MSRRTEGLAADNFIWKPPWDHPTRSDSLSRCFQAPQLRPNYLGRRLVWEIPRSYCEIINPRLSCQQPREDRRQPRKSSTKSCHLISHMSESAANVKRFFPPTVA